MKTVSKILVLVCIFAIGLVVPSMASSVDMTPQPDVIINYNVSSYLANMEYEGAEPAAGRYFVYADASYNQTVLHDLDLETPLETYWEIAVDGGGNVSAEGGLFLAPDELILVSAPAEFDPEGEAGAGTVDGIAVDYTDVLGFPSTAEEKVGSSAVVFYYGGIYTYYVYSDYWNLAVAKVGDLYYEDFSDAVAAANGGAGDIILLEPVTVSTSISVNTGVDIYCCNGSDITVASGGKFYINGGVFDNDGSERQTIYLTDGGDISDFAANIISATLAAEGASVTGANTVLTVAQATPGTEFTVNINGSFADLEGQYFAITNGTTINDTDVNGDGSGSAYITAGDYPLTINGGEVHVSYAMTETKLQISGGELWLAIPSTQATWVTGITPYSGDIYIESGAAWVLGAVNDIYTYGDSADETGGTVYLLGTAASATVTGNSVLAISSRDGVTGRVTPGDVTGVPDDGLQGVLRTSDVYTTYANGTFERIEGSVTMRNGDLFVMDAADLATVTGNSLYSLEIFGSSTMRAQNLVFAETFDAISIHNISVTLDAQATVNSSLNLYYDVVGYVYPAVGVPVMTVEDGAHVGILSAMASGVIEGIINITNSSIFSYFVGEFADNGVNYAEFHMNELCYTAKSSFVGVEGEFQSLTGRVCTCGDLIVHSTVESADMPVYVTVAGAQLNSAVITGGMVYSSGGVDYEYVNGYLCSLTLDDAAGSTGVELYGGDFQYVEVNDAVENATSVSLTMYDGYNVTAPVVPVAIGTTTAGEHGTCGLDVSGDAATVVTLVTDDIYGTGYGVYLAGVGATITGSETDPALLKTISVDTVMSSPAGADGVYITNSRLVMANYAIIGNDRGVAIVGGSDAELTNVTVEDNIADWTTASGIGILLGNGSGDDCSLGLDTAAVTADTGIIVNGGGTLVLSNDITVTGALYGILVNNGTVTNVGDDTSAGTRFVTVTGKELVPATEIFAMYVEAGAVTLDGYTFRATALAHGSGFVTGNGTVTAVLSDRYGAGSTGAYIWGSAVGVSVGSNTKMTVSDYNILGASVSDFVLTNPLSINPESVIAGAPDMTNAGAKVYGELRLSGVNTILGGQYGVWSISGTVTNFMAAGVWTTDELESGAAPQGSGSILTGPLSSATALRAQGGTVTLGYYDLISIGVDTDVSCGLHATKYENGVTEDAEVYLCGDPADPDSYVVSGGTGAGVRVSDADVTIYNMMIETKSAYSAQVDSGVLSLGAGVTLNRLDTEGTETVRGMDADYSELHVINGNTDISAQGSFKNLTGYVTTTGDLTVTGTGNSYAYNTTDYTADATIMGGGDHDLLLGTDKVTAVLADDGIFASIAVNGKNTIQQDITVAGDLTVANTAADYDYALSATYADIEFAAGSETAYVRSFAALESGATGVSAGSGAVLYLTDTVNISGNSCGLYLNVDAVVTDMMESGAWLTAYSTAGTPVSSGAITATTSTGVCMEGSSVLLLGGYGIGGPDHAIDIYDNAAAYLLAGDNTGVTDTLSASSVGNTIVSINTTKWVTIEDYTAKAGTNCASAVKIEQGTVTLDGGYYSGELTCPALVILADQDGVANATLTGGAEFLSGMASGGSCVSVAGTGTSQKALLTIADAKIDNSAETGVLIGAYGEVTMTGGSIIGDHLDTSEALYGVRLTAPTSVFTMSGGTIGFKDGITVDTAGVYAEGCTVTVSDGVIGKYTYTYQESEGSEEITVTVYADTGIDSKDRLIISGGSVYGSENAVYQEAGNAWICGGVLDTDNTTEMIDTVIQMNGSLWITGGTVRGVVNGKENGDACLYIKPADALTVYVGGDFDSMTGSAKVNGIYSLTVGNTTDALNVFDEGHYANGSADAYDKLVLKGESATTMTVAISNGTAEIFGEFGALTVGDGDDAAAAEVTLTGNVSLTTGGLVQSDGVLTVPEGFALTITTAYSTLTDSGIVASNGTVTGTVSGTGGKLTLANESESGTNVNVQGTFAELDSLNANNTFTIVDDLTVNGTREETEEAEAGAAYVIGNDAGGLTVAEGAVVYSKGEFDAVTGPVILWGDTIVNGSGAAVVTDTAGTAYYALTVNDTAGVTLKDGSFSAFTVNGGTLTLEAVFSVSHVSVTSGSIVMTSGKLHTSAIAVGDSVQATMNAGSASYLVDTLAVSGNKITAFPKGLSNGTYQGWYVSGDDSTIVSDAGYGDYVISGGETLLMKFVYAISIGGGSSSYTVDVTMGLADETEYSGSADQLGTATLSGDVSAGSAVTLTVEPGTSFTAGSVAAQTTDGVEIQISDNGDGTYGFTMPAADVEISVEFVPLLGEPQTTPEIEYAVLSPQKIYLNGEEISIMAYNVNGNNYFKLRDIAYFLNGTGSQFAVDFTEDGLVILMTGEAYAPVGGEAVLTADQSATCVVSAWSLQTDGVLRYLKCYNIAGNNFFQLRELGELLGFGVSYDEATNSVLITTE